jgi:poly(A) polymerase
MMAPRSQHKSSVTMRQAAEKVVAELAKAGHVALFVGGCVRDMLMKRVPKDFDVATSARPQDVLKLFRRTQKVGAKFGVVLVRIGAHPIEVATFRADGDYEDGRHPTEVRFTDDKEDAQRRDFTINGLFYDPASKTVIDHVGGQKDIEAGIIRAIGDPRLRFTEDHLRILRAIRFASRFDFRIEPKTWSAMVELAAQLKRISPERIRMELEMMLPPAGRARAFRDLCACGALTYLFPEAQSVLADAKVIGSVLAELPDPSEFDLALATILHRLTPKQADSACQALRCSNQTRKTVTWLVARQDSLMKPRDVNLADLKLRMAHPAFGLLMALMRAKLKAANDSMSAYRTITSRAAAIAEEDVAPPPLLSGDDLAKLGLPAGPLYKRILDEVYYEQLNETIRNKRDAKKMAMQLVLSSSDP